MTRPSQARLDLSALRHNVALARELAPQARLMAVVKANAYGHGAVTMARELEPRVDALAVACSEEALELREAGIRCPILLMEGVFESRELTVAAEAGFWVTGAAMIGSGIWLILGMQETHPRQKAAPGTD